MGLNGRDSCRETTRRTTRPRREIRSEALETERGESDSELSSVESTELKEAREAREARTKVKTKTKTRAGDTGDVNTVVEDSEKKERIRVSTKKTKIEGEHTRGNSCQKGRVVVKEVKIEEVEELEEVERQDGDEKVAVKKRKLTKKEKVVTKGEQQEGKVVPKRRRKTKEEKEAEKMPLAERTLGLRMLVGAHVSIAQGVHNAITGSVHIGGNALALFLKSQRKWTSPPLDTGHAQLFRALCKEHGIDQMRHVLPHGSYLVNLAQGDPAKHKQAYDCFLDDIKRCEELGIGLYNFHPGSTLGNSREEALTRIAEALNSIHAETSFTKLVLENMAGSGNIIGSTLSDLAEIIAQIKNQERIGVCIDTCHTFAAGYDIRTPETAAIFWKEFDDTIGWKYLSGIHLNDSKAPLGGKRDLHCNIGEGFLGLGAFRVLMNMRQLEGIPLILETPMNDRGEKWSEEIKLLEWLIGKDGKEWDEEVEKRAKILSERGRLERERVMEQVTKRLEKLEKGKEVKESGGGRRRKKAKEE